jgi:hypothetical protein
MDKTDVGFDAAMFPQRFDPFNSDYGPHFREAFKHMRATCPVAHTTLGGTWVVTRYDDIARVLRDPVTFSSSYGVFTSRANPRSGPNGEAPRETSTRLRSTIPTRWISTASTSSTCPSEMVPITAPGPMRSASSFTACFRVEDPNQASHNCSYAKLRENRPTCHGRA